MVETQHRPDSRAGVVRASPDPCVGKFLEFRIVRDPAKPDRAEISRNPDLIPNPNLTNVPVSRERTFLFGWAAATLTGL